MVQTLGICWIDGLPKVGTTALEFFKSGKTLNA